VLVSHAAVGTAVKKLQVLTTDVAQDQFIQEWVNSWIQQKRNIILCNNWKDAADNTPVFCYSDLTNPNVPTWLHNQQPAVYVGRGYLGNHLHKKRVFYRASVNGWANTVLKQLPYSRWNKMNLSKHSWKVKQVRNVLIAPSKITTKVWSRQSSPDWAADMSTQFPGAEIRIRLKPGKAGNRYSTLWEDLDWADLVVSQSSAITCEAFWYGKKVISTEPCPTWAAGRNTLEDWANPTEPALRAAWHEHIAWCQYTRDEWHSGQALDLLEQYLGPVVSYDPEFQYSFT
jgi:hypothetical protein